MLHYLHQLVSNCVCLMFGAEQVVYDGFFRAFSLRTAAVKFSDSVRPNSKVSVSFRVGEKSLWVCLYERHLSHTISHVIHCYYINIDHSCFRLVCWLCSFRKLSSQLLNLPKTGVFNLKPFINCMFLTTVSCTSGDLGVA